MIQCLGKPILILMVYQLKMYSTLKRIHSWPHQRRIATVVAISPHQRPASSCCALGHCLQSAPWPVDLGENTGMHTRIEVFGSIYRQMGTTRILESTTGSSMAYGWMGQLDQASVVWGRGLCLVFHVLCLNFHVPFIKIPSLSFKTPAFFFKICL